MSEWAAKRFWTTTETVPVAGGFGIALDGRPVKTPAKAGLVLPTAALAAAVAEEWDAQTGKVDPTTMPVTRGANAAIDKVAIQHGEVVEMLAAYGDSDLLCYRATEPAGLVARQAKHWDPLLNWAEGTFGTRLQTRAGVMHVPQDPDGLTRLKAALETMSAFELAAAHDLVSLSGSLVIGLAVIRQHITPEQGWTLSRVDEDWQIDEWGEDDEARALEQIKRAAFYDAARFYRLCQN